LHNPGPARVIAPDMRASRASRDIEALPAISLETPALLPLSPSAFLTPSFRACPEQPIFAATDRIACQRDLCCPPVSRTSRIARSQTSGENLFVVLLIMPHPPQKLEPPAHPARFYPPRPAGPGTRCPANPSPQRVPVSTCLALQQPVCAGEPAFPFRRM
jgi:hypothetical protein